MKQPKKHTLDIFQVLSAIDCRDFDFLERQTEADRKGFTPTTALRWASAIAPNGNESDAMLWLVNEYANFDFYAISDHPELQFKLLAAAGLGRKSRHQWLNMPKRKGSGFTTLCEFLLQWHPSANDDEINILLSQYSRDTFGDYINSCGCDKTHTKELLDAWDKHHGVETKKSREAKKKC